MTTLQAPRDDRKTAAIVAKSVRPEKGARMIKSFVHIRDILRAPDMLQGGGGAEHLNKRDLDKAPVFFLDGEPHKKKRSTIARYFTPKIITARYHEIMERIISEQLSALQRDRTRRLDLMSFDLAVAVASDIVGLTVTDRGKMARRLSIALSAASVGRPNFFIRTYVNTKKALNFIDFFYNDVKPTIKARTATPQDDIISHLIKEGYSDKTIMIECMTYASAGMVTTREFIVISAWHLFDNDALRARFLAGDHEDQFAIIQEILRLETIASFLYRRTEPGKPLPATANDGEGMYGLCIRDANSDESMVGECPHMIDPDRAAKVKDTGGYLSFGDGAHLCPGKQVALHETRMFLDALFRVPGIRLTRAPDVGWSSMLQSYELRNAVVACD